jgi:hypothetical protein
VSAAPLSPTARRAIAAYGGPDRWERAQRAEGKVTMSGLLFNLKWRHLPAGSRIGVDLKRPFARLEPIDRKGRIGVLDGLDVRLEDPKGGVLESRTEARRFFPYGRRAFYWDALDLTYFLGYAFWAYFALPVLLQRDDIAWTEIKDGLLEARFPGQLPRHSEIQRYYFDGKTGLLARNDYTADVFGRWAQAANIVQEHKEWEGIPFPSRRRVTRRENDGTYRPMPTMIGMEISEWRLFDSP